MFLRAPNVAHPTARLWYGTFLILLRSGLLFWVKVKALALYAWLEFAFALGVCVSTLSGMGDQIQIAHVGSLFASI
jgi:hypothetical protein